MPDDASLRTDRSRPARRRSSDGWSLPHEQEPGAHRSLPPPGAGAHRVRMKQGRERSASVPCRSTIRLLEPPLPRGPRAGPSRIPGRAGDIRVQIPGRLSTLIRIYRLTPTKPKAYKQFGPRRLLLDLLRPPTAGGTPTQQEHTEAKESKHETENRRCCLRHSPTVT